MLNYIVGIGVAILSLYLLLVKGENHFIFSAAFFLCLICLTDTFYTRIPNILTGIFILAGLGLQFWTFGVPGVTTGFLGGLTGLALLLIPFLMGGMGAGDVKALAALGTVTGPAGIFQVFLYMGVFGGVMAIIHYIAAGKLQERLASFWSAILVFAGTKDKDSFNPVATGEKLRFPYAAAIALGYFTYIQMGTVWG